MTKKIFHKTWDIDMIVDHCYDVGHIFIRVFIFWNCKLKTKEDSTDELELRFSQNMSKSDLLRMWLLWSKTCDEFRFFKYVSEAVKKCGGIVKH